IDDLGQEVWDEHQKTVEGFWQAILDYFDTQDVSGVKIYQDGMVAEDEIGEKIVEEGVKQGSKNYELISNLLKRGAVLIKTEDFQLLKRERDYLVAITQAKSVIQKLAAFIKYKFAKRSLLKKRDEFIVKTMDATLRHSEKAILFIGASHNVKEKLPNSFQVTEIKDIQKVREYQSMLPFYHRYKNRVEELAAYLIYPIRLDEK
ncbi:MAG: hypothetical protein ABIH08_01560, partial [Candidatus Omnitrophota bacterium]